MSRGKFSATPPSGRQSTGLPLLVFRSRRGGFLAQCSRDARAHVVPIVCLHRGRPIPLDRIPYGSDEWKRLYRGCAAVEREFGRLKNEYGLTPLRTRGLARVRPHADLVMIAPLRQALAKARAVPLPA